MIKKTNPFWRSQHETFLRLTKNEPMVLVRIWKVFTRIGEIYSEKERALQIYIMTSKFKLCFVIDVVTIWYSLYWHRIVFDKNQSLWSQLFVMGNWYICCWNKKWSILFYFYYDHLFSDVLAYQENNFVVLALKDWKDELKPDSRVGRRKKTESDTREKSHWQRRHLKTIAQVVARFVWTYHRTFRSINWKKITEQISTTMKALWEKKMRPK